jgi:hypothetical protein
MFQLNFERVLSPSPDVDDLSSNTFRGNPEADHRPAIAGFNANVQLGQPSYHQAVLVEHRIGQRRDKPFDLRLESLWMSAWTDVRFLSLSDPARPTRSSLHRIARARVASFHG